MPWATSRAPPSCSTPSWSSSAPASPRWAASARRLRQPVRRHLDPRCRRAPGGAGLDRLHRPPRRLLLVVFDVGTDEFRRVIRASLLTAGLIGVSCYLLKFPLSRGFFSLVFLLGIPALLVGRLALRRRHAGPRRGSLLHRVLLVGAPRSVDDVAGVLRRERCLGYARRRRADPRRRRRRDPDGHPRAGPLRRGRATSPPRAAPTWSSSSTAAVTSAARCAGSRGTSRGATSRSWSLPASPTSPATA